MYMHSLWLYNTQYLRINDQKMTLSAKIFEESLLVLHAHFLSFLSKGLNHEILKIYSNIFDVRGNTWI